MTLEPRDAGAFLGLPPEASDSERARVHVLPIPFEATVSYGGGAAGGPAALLEASRQVELYDRDFDAEPALAYGIHTHPPVMFPEGGTPADAVARIARRVAAIARPGRLLLSLGGEHTASVGVFDGLARALGGTFAVVHLDAHADLRDAYEGEALSHACALRRIAGHPACGRIWQLGIRSVCAEEMAYIRANPGKVRIWFAETMADGAWREELRLGVAGRRVVVTFDVDALDPSVVPGTGTPEPDGLAWRQALAVADVVAGSAASVAALDCVETAPAPGLHYSEFNVAKLLYGMLNRFCPLHPRGTSG